MHKDRLLITRKIPCTNNNTLKGHDLSHRKFVLPIKTVIKRECYETVNQAPAIHFLVFNTDSSQQNFGKIYSGK